MEYYRLFKGWKIFMKSDELIIIELKAIEQVMPSKNFPVVGIHQKIMEKLRIKEGDIVSIKGNRETAAVAKLPMREIYQNTIEIPEAILVNTSTRLGGNVKIKKVFHSEARNILLSPKNVLVDEEIHPSQVWLNYSGCPVIVDDIVFLQIIHQKIPFRVSSTEPSGIVIISESTEIFFEEIYGIGRIGKPERRLEAEKIAREGKKLMKSNQIMKAIDLFWRAIELDQDYYDAWKLLGIGYFFVEDHENASRYLEKVIHIDPIDEIAFYIASISNFHVGNKATAIKYLKKAFLMRPQIRKSVKTSVVVHPEIPFEFMADLIEHPDKKLRELIAEKAEMSPILIEILCEDEDLHVRKKIALRSDLTYSHLKKLAKDKNPIIQKTIVEWHTLSKDIIDLLVNQGDSEIKKILIKSGKIYPDVKKQLVLDEDDSVREAVAQSKYLSNISIEKLALDKVPRIREIIAQKPELDKKILKILVHDKNRNVRLHIVQKVNLPLFILKELARDEDEEIKIRLAFRRKLPYEIFEILAKDENRRVRNAMCLNYSKRFYGV